jgi:hypothetical protein
MRNGAQHLDCALHVQDDSSFTRRVFSRFMMRRRSRTASRGRKVVTRNDRQPRTSVTPLDEGVVDEQPKQRMHPRSCVSISCWTLPGGTLTPEQVRALVAWDEKSVNAEPARGVIRLHPSRTLAVQAEASSQPRSSAVEARGSPS